MLQKPKECDRCILSNYNGGFSQPEGNCKNGVLIIGEALGENEKQDGLPLRPYAESGSALQTCIRNLKKFGINQERQDFGLWNLIACQPPRNILAGARYEKDAILTCRENYFDKVVEFYKPKVILALGNLTLKYLVPEISSLQESLKEKLKEFKGDKDKEKRIKAQLSKLTISALRGYKFNSIYNIPLVPSFHPSFITRGERVLLGVLLRDLMFALEIVGGEIAPYKFENYIEYPSELDLQDFIRTCYYNPNSPISYDIETSFTPLVVDETEIEFGKEVREIESVQFSIPISDNGKVVTKSIFLDWEKDIDYIKSILKLSNSKVGWNNWQFDETNLKYHLGEDAINGIRYDSMWLFKHLNADFKKTGRALQFAANFYIPNLPAWKHISESEPRKYGLIDVDATLKTFLGLRKDMEASKLDAPKTKNLFEGYVDDIVKLYPILQKMSQRGIPINIPERTKFDEELAIKQAKVLDELQEVYPTELRRPDPILGYKNIPKEVLELTEIFNNKYLDYDSPNYVVFISNKEKDLALSRFIEINSRRKPEDYEERKSKKDVIGQTGLVVKEFIVDGQRTKRYCRLDRFKPNSKDQILAYAKHKGYKIKKKKVGKEEKESTEKDAMFDLYEQTKDDFFLKVGLYKEFSKIRKTYIHGWKTDSEGRVHSTFLPLPATGQLSSVNPNVQNAPGHGSRYNSKDYLQMASRFRNCIEARPGHTFIECVIAGTKILMKDLTWKNVEELKLDDDIIGIDETLRFKANAGRSGRYLKFAKIEEINLLKLPCIKITTDCGTITCSKGHGFLQRYQGKAGWHRADTMRVGEEISFFTEPWEVDNSYEGGYLAGFFDGEGWIRSSKTHKGVGFAQNNGATSNYVYATLINKGFEVRLEGANLGKSCQNFSIAGHMGWLKFIGSIRPKRLYNKVHEAIEGMPYWGRGSKNAKIIKIEDVGVQEVYSLKTSSKTYISNGLISHNCDYTGFHAIMLGVEAEDATYVRLAKLGVHDFLTAHMIRNEYASKKRFIDITKLKSSTKELNDLRSKTLEWIEDLDNWLNLNDDELSIKLQWIKKNHKLIRDAQAKPAVHGMGFGMGANKFFKLNKHAFSTIEEPKRILNLMRSLFPKIYHPITGWQEAVKLEAHEKTYLLSRYGYIRRFWDVYDFRLLTEFRPPKSEYEKIFTTKDGKIWLRTDGQQIKEAVAFRPANNAFGKKKEAMRDMEERGLLDRYGLILDNHDSLLFECQNSLVEDCIRDTKHYMELPTRHISTSNFPNGIVCSTEVKVGKRWGSLEKVKE